MVDWSEQQTSNEVTDEMRDLLVAISACVEARPEVAERLDAMLARALREPIGPDSLDPVHAGVRALLGLGADPLKLLVWIAQDDDGTRLDEVLEDVPPAMERFLRGTLALYGPQLVLAFRRWREQPHDWELVHRETYFDLIAKQVLFRLDITRYDGEVLRLSLDANSLLMLATNLVRSLEGAVPARPFSDERIEAFDAQVDSFRASMQAASRSDGASPEATVGHASR